MKCIPHCRVRFNSHRGAIIRETDVKNRKGNKPASFSVHSYNNYHDYESLFCPFKCRCIINFNEYHSCFMVVTVRFCLYNSMISSLPVPTDIIMCIDFCDDLNVTILFFHCSLVQSMAKIHKLCDCHL